MDLKTYFSEVWSKRDSGFDNYEFSGWTLVDKVSSDERVLDVGCGKNPFKGKIVNLVGIDPSFQEADIVTTLEDYQSDQLFDVVFCLGSVNFGDESIIESQIAKIASLLTNKGRIYWRCNPGRHDHGNQYFHSINVYPWSFEKHRYFAEKFDFDIRVLDWDTNNRIYAEWVRS